MGLGRLKPFQKLCFKAGEPESFGKRLCFQTQRGNKNSAPISEIAIVPARFAAFPWIRYFLGCPAKQNGASSRRAVSQQTNTSQIILIFHQSFSPCPDACVLPQR